MQTEELRIPLPTYYYSQNVRCIVKSTARRSGDTASMRYLVELPGDRRMGFLDSDDKSLEPGSAVDATFTSHFGRAMLFTHSASPVKLEYKHSEEDLKTMSFPIMGSLVSVTVLEASGDEYLAVYKDCFGESIKGALVSSKPLEPGQSLDVGVTGWSPATISFVAIQDIEKEIGRAKERGKYFSVEEIDKDDFELDQDWFGAISMLGKTGDIDDIMQPMRDKAEALIDNLKNEGLDSHWDRTVEMLKMYAFPKEFDQVSLLLKGIVEKYSEDAVIEFLSYRLHPDKECPLNPITKDILQELNRK